MSVAATFYTLQLSCDGRFHKGGHIYSFTGTTRAGAYAEARWTGWRFASCGRTFCPKCIEESVSGKDPVPA